MKFRPYLILINVIIIGFILQISESFADEIATAIFNKCSPAVVKIKIYNSIGEHQVSGSGFAVRSDGIIATNYHVISEAHSAKVTFYAKNLDVQMELDVVGVVWFDKEQDVALIKVDGSDIPTVKLSNSESMLPGEDIYVISNPLGYTMSITKGLFNARRIGRDDIRWMQIDANISPGSSGGPVFNSKGEVIAIIKGTHTSDTGIAQNVNQSIPSEAFSNHVNDTSVEPFDESIAKPYEQLAYNYYELGNQYEKLALNDEALEALSQSLNILPDLADAHMLKAHIYVMQGDKESSDNAFLEATKYLNEAIKKKPDSLLAYRNLGLSYWNLDSLDESIRFCKAGLQKDSSDISLHYLLGLSYITSDKIDLAQKEYEIIKNFDKDAAESLLQGINKALAKKADK
jgi:Tfp pilus assembly protein PilF